MGRNTWRALVALVVAVAGMLPAVPAVGAGDVEIFVLSNRADLVSGGDALVEVVTPSGADASELRVDVDGRDVTASFGVRDGGRIIGLVDGLALGRNVVTATLGDGSGARIALDNHPVGGPAFSGPHLTPWLCTTGREGLGDPVDEHCNAPTTYEFHYWSTEEEAFASYDPENPPSDVGETTTDEGVTVPYVVRVERGTINRGLYAIAVLFDPAQPWEPWAPQQGWNGKLFYPFGASCNTNYNQGTFGGVNVLQDKALSRGFAVATSTLNILGQHCNTVLSAETMMMVKEHLVDTYGEVRYTFGEGGSGGSIGQLMVANAYPGLLQGLIPSQTFPDNWTTNLEVQDCHILLRYFNATSPQLWADQAQQTAVNGHEGTSSCIAWEGLFAQVQDPQHGCGLEETPEPNPLAILPPSSVRTPEDYNPVTNPDGCRATTQDIARNIWGLREEDGFAKLVYDNVGVEYGRSALDEEAITPAQFVDLNAKIGGLDIDHNFIPERSVADEGTPLIGHETGASNDGRGLDQVAIIDLPPASNVEIHTPYHAFALEERLLKAHGTADNHAIWRGGDSLEAFVTMDEWLSAIEADTTEAPLPQKIIANRPESVVDSCFIDGEQVLDVAACDEAFPYYGDARIAAGSPLAHDTLKCTLQPLDRSSYGVEFTDDQWASLEAAFPDGVCDWGVPGEGQVESIPWLTFTDGPGGRPLGDPPVSEPFGPGGRSVSRYAGPSRLETAAAVSGRGITGAETVVLARADAFPDALAGGPLAVALDAPLLLTASDELSATTAAEIRRLGATEAVLLGGEAALAPAVAEAVEGLGLSVRRIAGPDRYATAATIAAELPAADEALVARGDAFPDALSASALGAALGLPILLVETDRVPAATAAALSAERAVTVVGGPAAVSDALLADLDARAGEVRRLSGGSRYGTSAAVAQETLARGLTADVTWVATGRDFPDALVAGAAAGRDRGLLLLVDGHDLSASPETRDLLAAEAARVASLRIAGGTAAITAATEDALRALLG